MLCYVEALIELFYGATMEFASGEWRSRVARMQQGDLFTLWHAMLQWTDPEEQQVGREQLLRELGRRDLTHSLEEAIEAQAYHKMGNFRWDVMYDEDRPKFRCLTSRVLPRRRADLSPTLSGMIMNPNRWHVSDPIHASDSTRSLLWENVTWREIDGEWVVSLSAYRESIWEDRDPWFICNYYISTSSANALFFFLQDQDHRAGVRLHSLIQALREWKGPFQIEQYQPLGLYLHGLRRTDAVLEIRLPEEGPVSYTEGSETLFFDLPEQEEDFIELMRSLQENEHGRI